MTLATNWAPVILDGSLLAALPLAALAGLISFVSPCVLPLLPGYIGYLTALSGATNHSGRQRPRLFWGVLLFVLGFTAVFVLLGLAFASAGAALASKLPIVMRVLGVLVIALGLIFMGALPLWQKNRQVQLSRQTSLWGAPLLGAIFGLGWTPCIGPTLAAVLTLSMQSGTQTRGVLLGVCYSLGLGLPFILLGLTLERSQPIVKFLQRQRRKLLVGGGVLLVLLGIALVTGFWETFTGWLQHWIDGFWVAV